MSEGNVRVAREIIAAWNRGETAREWLADDVEYVNPPDAMEPGIRRGVDAFERAVAAFNDVWDAEILVDGTEAHPGDVVLLEITLRVRGRLSGVTGETRQGWLWTVRDGKGTRFRWFPTLEQARAALTDG